jgi:Protein of unknown function (DUF1573)
MNATLKTVLLTILTLSAFTIAMIELSGVSSTAVVNKLKGNDADEVPADKLAADARDAKMKAMPKTTFEFVESKHDFGTIHDGDKVRWSYKVKNTGDKPLLISNVVVSCGCTAPFYPKEPIMPGIETEVTLEFNSSGKEGNVVKNALVNANVDNSPYSIGFTANVLPKIKK